MKTRVLGWLPLLSLARSARRGRHLACLVVAMTLASVTVEGQEHGGGHGAVSPAKPVVAPPKPAVSAPAPPVAAAHKPAPAAPAAAPEHKPAPAAPAHKPAPAAPAHKSAPDAPAAKPAPGTKAPPADVVASPSDVDVAERLARSLQALRSMQAARRSARPAQPQPSRPAPVPRYVLEWKPDQVTWEVQWPGATERVALTWPETPSDAPADPAVPASH